MLYLILLFTILFFILAWRRLDLAVMFLIAALPVYLIRFNIFGLPSTLLEVMIWLVFLVWFLKNYRYIIKNLKLKIGYLLKIENCKLKINNRYPFDWEIILLLLVAFITAGVAGFSSSSLGIWKAYFFEPMMLFIVVVNLMKKSPLPPFVKGGISGKSPLPSFIRGVKLALWPLAISALTVSFLAIYQKITGQLIDNPLWAAAATRRAVSFFGYPNAVGLYLGPIVLVLAGWLVDTVKNFQFSIFNFQSIFNFKIFKIFFIFLVIIISVLSIYFAKSKGALLGVAAGLIVFGLLAGKKISWAVVIAMLITAAGILAYQPARQLTYQTLTFKTFSGQIRLAGWKDSWQTLKDGRLLSGAGLANFQSAVIPYHTPGIFIKDYKDPDAQRKLVFNPVYRAAHWQPLEIYLYPHNIILNFWSELGLAGVLLFIWIIGKFLVIGIWKFGNLETQKNKYLVIGLISAMTVIVIHGAVDVPYFKNDLAVMFWLLVAMMSLINIEKNYGAVE